MSEAKSSAFKRLGRLASLGPKEPWQVALFLPESYEDLSQTVPSAYALTADPSPIWLTIAGQYKAYYDRVPRLVLPVTDESGDTFSATIFGDTKEWMPLLDGISRGCFVATGKEWNGRPSIEIRELIEDEWVNRVRPKYAGKKQVITPQTARRTVLTLLSEAIPEASAFVARELGAPMPMADVLREVGAAGWTLEQLLLQAHQPQSMRHAQHAQKVLRRIAAIGALQRMHADHDIGAHNPIVLTTLEERIAQLPVTRLTEDQRSAIDIVAKAMAQKHPLNALLLGEVGTGKTIAGSVVAAATIDARPDGCVMILCPNTLLAKQFHREISSYYPDIRMKLVTGETASNEQLDAPILVGTSALLFRDIPRRVELVVCDEQHRWSREQRETHVKPGTHLLEMSATPIPRSLALVRYGKSTVIQMRQTHAEKRFHTKLITTSEDRRKMFGRLNANIQRGDIALVVYPKRDVADKSEQDGTDLLGKARPETAAKSNKGAIDDRHAVTRARERWESLYPGLVGTLTSDDDETEKVAVLSRLGERKIQVLLCTTVIEVGITIPELFIIVIMCPERLGLMQLHQLRGRVARNGGDGHCLLFSPDPLSPKQRERLEFFCKTTDGFALAEYDMFERGIGDLSSTSSKQTGADETFLFGIKMDARSLDEVAPLVARWRGRLAAA